MYTQDSFLVFLVFSLRTEKLRLSFHNIFSPWNPVTSLSPLFAAHFWETCCSFRFHFGGCHRRPLWHHRGLISRNRCRNFVNADRQNKLNICVLNRRVVQKFHCRSDLDCIYFLFASLSMLYPLFFLLQPHSFWAVCCQTILFFSLSLINIL